MGMYRGNLMKEFILLLFLCLFCSTSYADIATGLVGWWKFDEASSGTCTAAQILDASGNANTGTCHASPTWIAGHIGLGAGAFASASSQYVQTAAATNIPAINGALTYSAWVHCTTITAIQDIVVTTNGTQGNQFRISATGYLQVSQWGATITVTATTLPLTTTGWYMVTWTSNGTTTQNLYVNGVLCTSTFSNAPQVGSPTSVVIGSYDAGEYFNGDIDDVRIYSRVLTQSDITQLYTFYTGRNGLFTLIGQHQ